MKDHTATRPAWLPWFVTVLVMTGAVSISALLLARQLRREVDRLERLRTRANACPERVVRSDFMAIDQGDAPASQPLGNRAYIEYGTDIRPLLRLRLERVRPGGGVDHVRVGSVEVLPSRSIHVIGLWATWCGACKQSLPELRALFARRANDWDGAVGFVPVQVLDPAAPDLAFSHWRDIMPPSRVQLADRTQDEFVKLLGDDSRRLYRGHLPVTLVLDCDRRVRWARLGGFDRDDLIDLEHRLDQFVAELRDDGSRCTQVWCGNGRCEAGEASHCADDCRPAESLPVAPPVLPLLAPGAPPPEAGPEGCPKGCARCDEQGRCHPLWNEPTAVPSAPVAPTSCGDKTCAPDEVGCCLDCGCKAPLVCREDASRQHICQSPTLWGRPT